MFVLCLYVCIKLLHFVIFTTVFKQAKCPYRIITTFHSFVCVCVCVCERYDYMQSSIIIQYLILTYLVLYFTCYECMHLCYNSLHAASSTETSRSGEQSHALDAPPPAGS